jgi:rubrerythrin
VRQAYEIELGGAAFYAQGRAQARDPDLATIFGRLEQMEQEHAALLSRRYHLPAPADSAHAPAWQALLGADTLPTETEALLLLALRLEQRACRHFEDAARALSEGSAAWRLCRELEAEEREHVVLIEDQLRRLRGGQGLAL